MIAGHPPGGAHLAAAAGRALLAATRGAAAPARRPPSGPAFTVVLIAHVAAVVIAMGAVVASGTSALRLRAAATGPVPDSVWRYFAPGVNWVGRSLVAVPLLGALLIALSGGDYGWGDGWVVAGLVLWAAATGLAESVVWPSERRVQAALAPARGASGPVPPGALAAAGRLAASSALVLAVLVAAVVVMFAKP